MEGIDAMESIAGMEAIDAMESIAGMEAIDAMEPIAGMEAIEGIKQCSPCIPLSPLQRAASECEIVGASVAIRIANNPSQLPIF
jgi:hypothetical protein